MPKNPEVFNNQTLIKGLYNPNNKFYAHFVSVLETDIVTPIQMAHLVNLPCTILTPHFNIFSIFFDIFFAVTWIGKYKVQFSILLR